QLPDREEAQPAAGPLEEVCGTEPRLAQHRVEEGRRVGRRWPAGRRRRPAGGAGCGHSLLGRDQVAVVRLPAVDDLVLGPDPFADRPGDRLGLGERRVLAVIEGDELDALRERVDGRQDRLLAVAIRGNEAIVRIEDDRLALLDLLATDLRVANRLRDLE